MEHHAVPAPPATQGLTPSPGCKPWISGSSGSPWPHTLSDTFLVIKAPRREGGRSDGPSQRHPTLCGRVWLPAHPGTSPGPRRPQPALGLAQRGAATASAGATPSHTALVVGGSVPQEKQRRLREGAVSLHLSVPPPHMLGTSPQFHSLPSPPLRPGGSHRTRQVTDVNASLREQLRGAQGLP